MTSSLQSERPHAGRHMKVVLIIIEIMNKPGQFVDSGDAWKKVQSNRASKRDADAIAYFRPLCTALFTWALWKSFWKTACWTNIHFRWSLILLNGAHYQRCLLCACVFRVMIALTASLKSHFKPSRLEGIGFCARKPTFNLAVRLLEVALPLFVAAFSHQTPFALVFVRFAFMFRFHPNAKILCHELWIQAFFQFDS